MKNAIRVFSLFFLVLTFALVVTPARGASGATARSTASPVLTEGNYQFVNPSTGEITQITVGRDGSVTVGQGLNAGASGLRSGGRTIVADSSTGMPAPLPSPIPGGPMGN